MKKLWIIISIVVVVALAIILSVTRAKKEPNEIRIGAILPLTGDAAVYGERLKEGIELSRYVFERQAINPRIDIHFEDSRLDPKEAVNAFYKLEQSNIKFIIGPYSSSEVLAVAPIAEKKRILVISPGASSPKITSAGDYIFRIVASDIYDGQVLAHYAEKNLKATSAGIVYINNDYGLGINEAFAKEFKSLNGNIMISLSFEPNNTDFRTYLLKLKQAKPDVVILIGFKEMGFFLKQMGELGLSFSILTTGLFENPDIIKIAGKFAEKVLYTMPYFDINGNDNVVIEFKKYFLELYPNKQPAIEHALGYDALNVLLSVMKGAQSSVEKVKQHLYETKNFPGVAGSLTFDTNGDVIKPYGIKQYKNGTFTWLIPIFKME
jgi:branched-chain amino acid transport system substrate-binding protein